MSPRTWELWSLRPALRAYVLATVLAALGATVAGAARTPLLGRDLVVFAALVGAGAAAVECRRRLGEPAGASMHDMLSVWWLPGAVLLPPLYSLLLPVPLLALSQWRVRRVLPHRRVFSAAAIGLVHAGASAAFHALVPPGTAPSAAWAAAVLACGGAASAANTALVAVAARTADPRHRWRDLLWDRERAGLEAAELCTATFAALATALAAPLCLLALPPVLLLQRGTMHEQLRAATRLDPKTGLLNALAWEREAVTELARAHRTGCAAAVLVVDVDHFKRVNDTHGHLAGDRVLVAVAGALGAQLRGGDLLGRFGGDEFVVLLPGADHDRAAEVARRLAQCVAALAVPLEGGTAAVTVSVGAAVSDARGLDLTDLLAAADAALYRVKEDGRDGVRVVPPPR